MTEFFALLPKRRDGYKCADMTKAIGMKIFTTMQEAEDYRMQIINPSCCESVRLFAVTEKDAMEYGWSVQSQDVFSGEDKNEETQN